MWETPGRPLAPIAPPHTSAWDTYTGSSHFTFTTCDHVLNENCQRMTRIPPPVRRPNPINQRYAPNENMFTFLMQQSVSPWTEGHNFDWLICDDDTTIACVTWRLWQRLPPRRRQWAKASLMMAGTKQNDFITKHMIFVNNFTIPSWMALTVTWHAGWCARPILWHLVYDLMNGVFSIYLLQSA